MLKTGVIGCGHLGRWHADKYAAMPNVELVGVYDLNPQTAADIAAKCNCKVFSSAEQLCQAVDAVNIAATTTAHWELASLALNNNCHVLVEKPITQTKKQAWDLVELANSKGLKLAVGHIERFNPVVLKVQHDINHPVFVESHRLAPFTPRGTEVPVVLDLMIHDIDLILAFVDSPVKSIHASGTGIFTTSTDIANARLEFENGAVANVTSSRVSVKRERKLRFFQQDAYLSLDFQNKKASIIKRAPGSESIMDKIMAGAKEIDPSELINVQWHDLTNDGGDALYNELESFVNCIINNTKPVVDGAAGARALEIALQIEEIINSH